jgi:hypothetical protein
VGDGPVEAGEAMKGIATLKDLRREFRKDPEYVRVEAVTQPYFELVDHALYLRGVMSRKDRNRIVKFIEELAWKAADKKKAKR